MPRAARRDAPGLVHHVLVRGIERRCIFRQDADREDFLGRLDRLVPAEGASCLAWALIPNHVHLVLRTGERPLAALMQRLNTGYACGFNRRHRRAGYLFQNRFHSIPVEGDAYLLALIRYVHLNPLRAGLVGSLSELAAYRWTGHAGLMGRERRGFHAVDEVLAWFGPEIDSAREALLCWMREGLQARGDRVQLPEPDSAAAAARPESAPGPCFEFARAEREPPDLRANALRTRGWTLDELVGWVCAERGVDTSRLRRGGRASRESRARALIGHLATRELGYTLLEVSRTMGISPGSMSRAIRRGARWAREERLSLPLAPPRRRDPEREPPRF